MSDGWMLRLCAELWYGARQLLKTFVRCTYCWMFGHLEKTRQFWELPNGHTFWDDSGHTVRFGEEVRCMLCDKYLTGREMAATKDGGRLHRDKTVGWGWYGDVSPKRKP